VLTQLGIDVGEPRRIAQDTLCRLVDAADALLLPHASSNTVVSTSTGTIRPLAEEACVAPSWSTPAAFPKKYYKIRSSSSLADEDDLNPTLTRGKRMFIGDATVP